MDVKIKVGLIVLGFLSFLLWKGESWIERSNFGAWVVTLMGIGAIIAIGMM